jgi:hypothetical protein
MQCSPTRVQSSETSHEWGRVYGLYAELPGLSVVAVLGSRRGRGLGSFHLHDLWGALMNRISKHQRWDSDGNWIPGKCRIFDNSSIRKLQRAMRPGKVPDERAVIIAMAEAMARKRREMTELERITLA